MADLSQDRVVSNNQKLYNNLLSSGKVSKEEVGDYETFNSYLSDTANVSKLHENLKKKGFDESTIGTRDEFLQNIDPVPDKITTQSVNMSENEDQPLTYMQKQLRERFPENYTEEKQPERKTSYIPEVTTFGENKQPSLVGSIPATNPDLSAKHPEYFAPKISDSYKTEKPTVIPQGTGDKFKAVDQKQLESELGGAQINSNERPVLSEEQKRWEKEHPTLNSMFSLPGMGIFKEAYIGTKKAIGGLGTTLDVIASNISNNTTGGAQIDEQGNITYPWEEGYKQDKSEFYNNVRKFEEEAPVSSGGTTAFLGQLLPQTAALAATVLTRNPTVTKAYLASMYGSSFGNGVETYDDYIKETGKQENPMDRYLVGMGYGAAEYIGEKVGLYYFMPKGYGKLVAKSLDASPNMAKEIGRSVLENYAKLTKQPFSAVLKKVAIGSQVEGGQEVATELIDIAIDKWLTGKDVTGQEIRDRLLQSYGGGALMGTGIAPFAHFSQNAATTERRRKQGNVTISIDEEGLPIEIVQSGDKVFGIRPDGEEVKNISEATLDKAATFKTEQFEAAIKEFSKTNQITTATIEGQQYTINNPEDLGQEGKPIFAKDAEGNITAVPNHKVENPITQTVREIEQAKQQEAERVRLYEGIADPNAESEVEFENEITDDNGNFIGNIKIVNFSNGQSKIIFNDQEMVANDANEKDRILNSLESENKFPEPEVKETGEVVNPIQKPVLEDGSPDYESMEPDMFFQEYSTEFGQESALQEIASMQNAVSDKIKKLTAKKEKSVSPNERASIQREIKGLAEKLDKLNNVSKIANNSEQQTENVSETQQQLSEQQQIVNSEQPNSQQLNQLENEKPLESSPVDLNELGQRPASTERENTPQAQQGQGVNEGLEENVNNRNAVDFVFNQNPELANIGTREQYLEYLRTIFTESQLRDIVFHGTKSKERFDRFDENQIGALDSGYFGRGFYFSPTQEYAQNYINGDGHVFAALLDLRNPLNTDANQANTNLSLNNNDGSIVRNGEDLAGLNETAEDPNGLFEIVATRPDQIHILGSTDDINGFKDFVNNSSTQQNITDIAVPPVATISQTPVESAPVESAPLINETSKTDQIPDARKLIEQERAAAKKAKQQAKQISPEERKLRSVNRAKALSIEPNTMEQLILQYFASGGKLNWNEIKGELFPRSHSEMFKRNWMLDKDAKSIDQLLTSGILEGSQFEEEGNQINGFRNAILDVVLRNSSQTQMVDRILEIGDQSNIEQNQADYEQRMAEAIQMQELAEQELIDSYWEQYVNNIDPNILESDINLLFLQDYEQPEKATDERAIPGTDQGIGIENRENTSGNNQGTGTASEGKTSQKELTTLEKEIQSLQDEKVSLEAEKEKLVKKVNSRNGIFGDLKADPSNPLDGAGFDASAGVKRMNEINSRISVIDRSIVDLSKKNEQVKATAEKENAGQLKFRTSDKPYIQETINELQAKAPNAAPVVIVNSIDEIPEPVRNHKNFNPKVVEAFWFKDKIYIIPEMIQSRDHLIVVWIHENGLHNGIRNIVPFRDMRLFMNSVYDSFYEIGKNNPEFQRIIDRVNKDYKTFSKQAKAEEFLAYLAERKVSESDLSPMEQTMWEKYLGMFRDFLRRLFNFNSNLLTEKQIIDIARFAVQSNFQTNEYAGSNARTSGSLRERTSSNTSGSKGRTVNAVRLQNEASAGLSDEAGSGRILPGDGGSEGLTISPQASEDLKSRHNALDAITRIGTELNIPVQVVNSSELTSDNNQLVFTNNGTVTIVSDRVKSVSEVIKALVKEVAGENGIREMLANSDPNSIVGKQLAKFDELSPEELQSDKLAQVIRKAFRLTSNQFTQDDLNEIKFRIASEKPIVEEVYRDQVKVNGEWFSKSILGDREFNEGDFVPELMKYPFEKINDETAYFNPSYIKQSDWDKINKSLTKQGFSKRPTSDWIDYFTNKSDRIIRYSEEHVKAFDSVFGKEEKPEKTDMQKFITKAKRYFGTTNNFYEAGYLLKDGSMLDFSGRKHGNRYPQGRAEDHREISSADENSDVDMISFMADGNIRMKGESDGFEVTQEPTLEQIKTLKNYIRQMKEGALVDFSEPGSYGNGFSMEYGPSTRPERIINDIVNYYRNDVRPVESNTIRFRILGETGASNLDKAEEVTTRLDNLKVAREMEQAGKDVKSIRLATGWERGKDGKFKYEVPDIEIKESFDDILNKVRNTDDKSLPLSDLINDNDNLFKEYPTLKNTKILFYATGSNNVAAFANNTENVIGITVTTPEYEAYRLGGSIQNRPIRAYSDDSFKSVLSHEIQHIIQFTEGFGRGGNPETVFNSIVENRIRQLQKVSGRDAISESEREEIEREVRRKYETSQRAYNRLVGEVESRNVQTRMNMTPEERLNTLLSETEDVSREDQIVLMDGLGVSNLVEQIPETITVNGVERPTTNSKGQVIHPTKDGIENFWKWFGDSLLVDKNGRPVVFYHGSNADFNIFNKDKIASSTDAGWLGEGFYFYEDEYEAQQYGKAKEFYLKLNEPYYASDEENRRLAEINDIETSKEFSEDVKANGYDGIYYNGNLRGETVVFDPNQIKSATGNNGSFSNETNDIRYRIEQERSNVNTEPSEAQREAGNYKKGHVRFDGFDISIENPKGSVRSGVDKQGNEWSQTLPADYGYFRGTVGKDKDHVDVFIGNKPEASNIYIIDQIDPQTGKFDEHKVMLGFDSQARAKQTYLAAFEPGWQGLGKITKTDKQGLKEWFEKGDQKKPFSDNHPQIRYRFAFHGSPHSFDKFSLDKIGTGEGAQAYGWGLYFTDKEGIAKNYAEAGNALTKWNFNSLNISDLAKDEVEKALVKREDDIYKAKVYLKALEQSSEMRYLHEYDGNIPADKQKHLNAIHEAFVNIDKLEQMPASRNLYTVKIHGDKTLEELNFLRWDKPVEQSTIDKINAIDKDLGYVFEKWDLAKPFSAKDETLTGRDLYTYLSRYFISDKAASEFLLRAGIDGIIYPAEYLSKGSHEDAFNYVVFDENAVQIQEHTRFRISPRDERIDQLREDLEKITSLAKSTERLDELTMSKIGKQMAERKTIVNQISKYKEGYRAGKNEKRFTLLVIQRNIAKYADENMRYNENTQAEIDQLLTAVRNANTPATIEKAFYTIDNLASKGLKRKLIGGISKILKSTRPKNVNGKPKGLLNPDTHQVLKKIREIIILKSKEDFEKYVTAMNEEDVESVALFGMFADLRRKSIDDIQKALDHLSDIVNEGKVWYKDEMKKRNDYYTGITGKILDKVTGGGPHMTEQEYIAAGRVPKDNFLNNYVLANQSLEWLLDIASKDKKEQAGEGWMQVHFGDLLNESTNKETKGIREAIELVNKAGERIFGAKENALARIFSQNSKVVKNSKVTFATNEGRLEIPLSQNQAAKRWMEMQDPTLDATFKKMGWDNQSLIELEAFMKPEVKKWAEWQLNEFYPEYFKGVNEAFRNNYFIDMPFNPKYSPIRREVIQQNSQDGELLKGSPMINSVMSGSFISRVANVNNILLQDANTVLFNHIAEMEHFKAWIDSVKEMRSTLGSRDVQHAIKFEHGNKLRQEINNQINDFASGGSDKANVITLIDRIRGNFAVGELALNLSLFPKQAISILTFMADVPIKNYLTGLVDMAINMKSVLNMMKRSEFIKERYLSGWNYEVRSALKKETPEILSNTKSKFNEFKNKLMFPAQFGDYTSAIGGWTVYKYYYEKQLALELLKPGITQEQAEQNADKEAMTRYERSSARLLQSSALKDASSIQKGSYGKMFTMFRSQPQLQQRYESAGWRNLVRGRGSKAHNLKLIALFHVLLPVAFQFMANMFTDDDDDEKRKRLWIAAGLGSLNGFLIASDVIEFLIEKAMGDPFDYALSPLEGSVNKIGRGLGSVYSGIKNEEGDDEKAKEQIVSGLDKIVYGINNIALGLPYRPAKKLIKQGGDILNPERVSSEKAEKFSKELFKEQARFTKQLNKSSAEDQDKILSNTELLDVMDDISMFKSEITMRSAEIRDAKNKNNDMDEQQRQEILTEYPKIIDSLYKELSDKYKDYKFPDSYKPKE